MLHELDDVNTTYALHYLLSISHIAAVWCNKTVADFQHLGGWAFRKKYTEFCRDLTIKLPAV